MASIKKRGNSYQVQIRRKGSVSKSKCFGTFREARAWATQQEALLEAPNSPLRVVRERAIPTLSEALQRYQSEITPHKKSARKELSFIRYWNTSTLASKRLSAIGSSDVAKQRDELLAAGRSPATVVRTLALLSHLYRVCRLDWGLALSNPVEGIRKPRVVNGRARRPTREEFAAVLSEIENAEIRIFMQLAAETAMRRGELFSLAWEDVNLVAGWVHLKHTKNGEDRVVVISNAAIASFEQLKPKKEGRVFTFTHVDTPSKAFRRAIKRARSRYVGECGEKGTTPEVCHLTNLRLHDLRHEATSSLFERGLSTVEVASITGHKTLAMLARYTHLNSGGLVWRLNRAIDVSINASKTRQNAL